jgi:superfamily II DNA/RNA helicase
VQRVEEEYAEDEAYEEETRAVVRTTSRGLRPLTSQEEKLTADLLKWAEKASSRVDSKAKALLDWLEALVRPNGKWSDTRVIIFTEYRTTQKWLEDLLAKHRYAQEGRLLTLYGGMKPEDREDIKHAFQSGPDVSPVRILLATDAASEGIDLQNHCSRLIHYEVPWNPNRMEQRNGRVDRHGQHADKVEIFHFVGKGWRAQRLDKETAPGTIEGDIEFLFRAAIKVNQIREDLGNVGDVLATQVEEAMLGKRKKLDTEKSAPRATAARKMLTLERKLAKQLSDLMARHRQSKTRLHLSPEAVKAVVDVGLEIANLPPLQATKVKGTSPGQTEEAWVVPYLGGTWAACLEGLSIRSRRRSAPSSSTTSSRRIGMTSSSCTWGTSSCRCASGSCAPRCGRPRGSATCRASPPVSSPGSSIRSSWRMRASSSWAATTVASTRSSSSRGASSSRVASSRSGPTTSNAP